ncbi:M23 family metallopeptidase [Ornithinicoccus halotolerans]|uniref:M23 family metallopeptidase n=1 Tax=Ornithinicoccus halotolerans TaxID=1748220 RepID=UPI001295B00C|nr:M23 family metallopeptidase [Ornithinicoccus halotolerans]
MSQVAVLDLPFTGRWSVQNSPARRVPSHGTDRLGTRYAIDFVGVDDEHRTAPLRDWRTVLATEPPERFVAFGRPILAPTSGTVVAVHDGEADHAARRSPLALVPYALGQAARLRQGLHAITGNYVTVTHGDTGTVVTLVHLRSGSLRVGVGDEVSAGQQLAECGNSGNSTQPHVHVQVTDSVDWAVSHGVPLRFRHYRELPPGADRFQDVETGVPAEAAVVEPRLDRGPAGGDPVRR